MNSESRARSEVDFEALVLEHHVGLYRFAMSMSRNEADACDLVQETFLRWAERGHQLDDVSRVKAWLYTTLFREANARRKRLLKFPHQDLQDVEAELPEIPAIAPQGADARLVQDALLRVDDPFRAAVALFYLEDYSYPEIADILGVPVGTAKSRVARGVAQLQQILTRPPQTTPANRPATENRPGPDTRTR
ncbi:MAG: RNA polymerase sigma factor [Verrucomicrobiales bacterium]|nr:RNA polymerase sigma factor [Verrucomicrobiales bacterium]